ncbi:MAG: hypothetical protein JRE64_24070 [Deltaproteobacteria bacterium]|nr:hypothetical protein [Deltaproteobacteria bacterium]
MLCNLTFKKAFGIETVPVDYAIWLIELGSGSFSFDVNNKLVSVKKGRFGISEQEKNVIGRFFNSDERDLNSIQEVLTLDIMFSVDLPIPEHQYEENPINTEIDSLVEPFMHDAFSATTRFIDAHRTAQYNLKRGSKEWKRGMILLIPNITETEFKTYLFYQFEVRDKYFFGCFSDNKMRIHSSVDNIHILQEINAVVENEIPLNSKLIVQAWECLFREDYRNSVIYAAIVLELMIIKTIRKVYISKKIATPSRIDSFIDNVSKRLLCTVILGSLGIGDEALRNKIASVFDIRNGLIHGKRKKVIKTEAEAAISDTEEFLGILEKL